MSWHVWLAFVAASALMGVIPGPGVMSIVGYAVSCGRRTALASVAGLMVGNAIAMILSLVGIGAVLAASASAFAVIKWLGALYLVFLGVMTIRKSRNAVQKTGGQAPVTAPRAAFMNNIAIGTFHPKTIIFFVAFVPQFISASGNYTLQATILVATFCLVVAITDTSYALTASRASQLLRNSRTGLWTRRAGGGVLIAAGVAAAATGNK